MAAEDQPVLKKDSTKFTWRIDGFSSLKGTDLSSDSFLAGGHEWWIDLSLPQGVDDDFLSVYLVADSESMPDGWSVEADFSFTLVNQRNSVFSWSSQSSYTHNFHEDEDSCEYRCPAPIKKLRQAGFLVNDTLVIEAEVSTMEEAQTSEAANDEPKVIMTDEPPKAIEVSFTDPLPPESQVDSPIKANGTRSGSFSSSTRNLIEELSTMIISCNYETSCSNSDHCCGSPQQQQQRKKLAGFLNTSLEALCQSESLGKVKSIALEISEQANDPLEKNVLEDLLSRLAEFQWTVTSSLSTIETSLAIESSQARTTKDLVDRLVHRKRQLTCLEAEVSRLEVEEAKLDAEIQQLSARKAKTVDQKNATAAELKKANQETCKELDEVKKQQEEKKQAGETRKRATEKLAHLNASWKLFKQKLGW
ncbi:Ubiquitin C-terminal hydrolase 13 [Linum grandiflorum]